MHTLAPLIISKSWGRSAQETKRHVMTPFAARAIVRALSIADSCAWCHTKTKANYAQEPKKHVISQLAAGIVPSAQALIVRRKNAGFRRMELALIIG
mmetsp:Transcript_59708/g.103899  ORF Transcript_59708/g.103899 Transcript_59708/m.103899 type:complete len:97 (+) Transcript_59708:296-586(+)